MRYSHGQWSYLATLGLINNYPNHCRVQEQFKGFDGHQLLSMKRSDLLAAFGRVEGDRLEGQITICRKTTGFGTASSELRDILVKARKRTETMRTDAVDDTTTSLA